MTNTRRPTLRHIVIKSLKTKDKQILKATKEPDSAHKGSKMRCLADFLSEKQGNSGQWDDISNCEKQTQLTKFLNPRNYPLKPNRQHLREFIIVDTRPALQGNTEGSSSG